MSDIYDQATEHEEQARALALQRQALKAPLKGDWRELSAKWCGELVCGQRIPDERRKAVPGVKVCVECQTLIEKKERAAR
jgi:phage/conjugal plasmid C-4 type zinc finger TraR family protein